MEVIQEHHQRLPWLDTKIKENKRSGEPGKSERVEARREFLACEEEGEPAEDVDEAREELGVEGLHFRHAQIERDRRLFADEELETGDHGHKHLSVAPHGLSQSLSHSIHTFLVL
jgi:hypothetical protein